MNILWHFLLNYLIINAVLGNPLNYIGYVLIFSTAIDIDHIPYILNVKKGLLQRKFGSNSRSRFHEIYGLTLFSFAASVIYIFNPIIAEIIFLSLILHYAADFLLGKTRPFYPFSEKEVFLNLCPQKYKMHFEIISTIVLIVIVWLTI